MSWFEHVTSLANPLDLIHLYLTSVFEGQIALLAMDVVFVLTVHAVGMYLLAYVFKRIVMHNIVKSFAGNFFAYLLAILLVLLSHVVDIIVLSVALDSLKVFSDPLHAFYYVIGMYTTVGSNYNPSAQWQGLAMIIPFCGLFAFSLSGSALFTILGYFLARPSAPAKQNDSD